MSHLGQFPARTTDPNAPVLPLPDDEVLFLFKCEWDSVCSFWDHAEGANRVVSLPRAQLGAEPGQPPAFAPQEDGEELKLLPELAVTAWVVRDDGVPLDQEAAFYEFESHNALPQEVAYPNEHASESRTKFGGAPLWTVNGAQGQPHLPPGRLLLQIDSWVTMADGSFSGEVANFCSDGTAYVFADTSCAPPVFSMIINR